MPGAPPPSLPTRGRQGVAPSAAPGQSGAGSAGSRLRFQIPVSARAAAAARGGGPAGRGPGGAQPAQPAAGATTRRLSPSIPAGLLCLPGAGARPVLPRRAAGTQPRGSILPGAEARTSRGAAADKARRQAGTPSVPLPSPRLRCRRCPRRRRQPRIPRRRLGPALPRPLPRGSSTCSEESIHLGVGDSAFLRRPFGGIHGWGRGGGEPGGW